MSGLESAPEASSLQPDVLAAGYADPDGGFNTPDAVMADLVERIHRGEITDIDAYNTAALLGILPESK